VTYPELTVQEGVRVFLTGGMAVRRALKSARPATEDARVSDGAGPGGADRVA